MASYSRKNEACFVSGGRGQGGLILVTGGARSGKSAFALGLADRGAFKRRLFVATAVACDGEMRSRIARHRRQRNGAWGLLEEPLRLPERLPLKDLPAGSVLLLDCLPTFVTNLLLAKVSPSRIEKRLEALADCLRAPGLTAIVVTNEVGQGVVPGSALGRRFRDLLGNANQTIASRADGVYLMVAGIPMRIK
ncbi:MAG: bifunctional adenosylcobinamide kinase/adenosylcobinamide-phosphate guanylyltransferase [Candidatus Omnitrophica bacterium]|nr:bifunctional adenosylcobinamide kinase/adenosylcobinamide-phosphate guanylyltransferase [Candidatus Omnitrophota bacterium]